MIERGTIFPLTLPLRGHKSLWSTFEGDAVAAVLTHIAPQARSRRIPAFVGPAEAARDPKLRNQQANCRLNVSVAGFGLRFRRPSIIAAGLGCLRGACRVYRLAASVRQEATQPTGDPSGPVGRGTSLLGVEAKLGQPQRRALPLLLAPHLFSLEKTRTDGSRCGGGGRRLD